MATVYFTASSLDGYIVDEADSLDWLTSRAIDKDGPFNYDAFINTIGCSGDGIRDLRMGGEQPSG